jgi:hypothetical protein
LTRNDAAKKRPGDESWPFEFARVQEEVYTSANVVKHEVEFACDFCIKIRGRQD